jgi:hypothetical protein
MKYSIPVGIRQSRASGVRFLGAPSLGLSDYTSDFVFDKAREVVEVMEKIQLLKDPQVKNLLLRSCKGICGLTHVLRCSPGNITDLRQGWRYLTLVCGWHYAGFVVGEGGGFGPLHEEIGALPIAAGGLGITRGADLAPMVYLASSIQTLPVQEEVLRDVDPVPPVVSAVSGAKDIFLSLVHSGHEGILDDPEVTSSGLQSGLSLLLSDVHREALLALPAQVRVVVITSAAEGSVSCGCWRFQ